MFIDDCEVDIGRHAVSRTVFHKTVLNILELVGYHYETVENECFGLHGGTVLVFDYVLIVEIEHRFDYIRSFLDVVGEKIYTYNLLGILGEFDVQTACDSGGDRVRITYDNSLYIVEFIDYR